MTAAERVAVGIDLGATKIAAGLVDATGRIVVQQEVPTVPVEGADAVIDRVAGLVRALAAIAAERGLPAPAGVGVGVAGLTRAREGVVADCPNLHGWREVPLAAKLRERLGSELVFAVDNDANAAAIGEAWAGAARGRRYVICLTLGTGVGGGLILDGAVYRGARDVGAELGHVVVVPDGPVCGCGSEGCLEVFASGTAVGRIARDTLAERPDEPSALRALDPATLEAPAVVDAAKAGDAFAIAVLATAGRHLGIALTSFANLFNPELIVVSGGLGAGAGDLIVRPARVELERRAFPAVLDGLEIVPAALGNDAGLVGAAALVLAPELAGLA